MDAVRHGAVDLQFWLPKDPSRPHLSSTSAPLFVAQLTSAALAWSSARSISLEFLAGLAQAWSNLHCYVIAHCLAGIDLKFHDVISMTCNWRPRSNSVHPNLYPVSSPPCRWGAFECSRSGNPCFTLQKAHPKSPVFSQQIKVPHGKSNLGLLSYACQSIQENCIFLLVSTRGTIHAGYADPPR